MNIIIEYCFSIDNEMRFLFLICLVFLILIMIGIGFGIVDTKNGVPNYNNNPYHGPNEDYRAMGKSDPDL